MTNRKVVNKKYKMLQVTYTAIYYSKIIVPIYSSVFYGISNICSVHPRGKGTATRSGVGGSGPLNIFIDLPLIVGTIF